MDLAQTIKFLNIVLGLGVIYSWYQFSLVVLNKCDTCSIGLHKNPFKSKCFVGAVFFTLSSVLALYALYLLP